MKKYIILCCLLLTVSGAQPMRIISSAPNITETVFLLGAGQYLVGVSKYCNFPKRAQEIPSIGGYVDFNRETILRLHPDRVLLQRNHDTLKQFLQTHDIAYEEYDNTSIKGIHNMILKIGELVNKRDQAENIIHGLVADMNILEERASAAATHSVLIVVEQILRKGRIDSVYVAGLDKYFAPLFNQVKLKNVYPGREMYPRLSIEALIKYDPEYIVVLEAGSAQAYQDLPLKAVKTGHILFFEDDMFKRPGPRYVKMMQAILEKIER